MLRAIVVGTLLGLLLTGPVYATHSAPYPRSWWDLDNDWFPDATDGDIGYLRAGGNWDLEKINDFIWATSSWRNNSHWDLFSATDAGGTGRATFRVDGVSPCGGWNPGEYGVSCEKVTARKDGATIDFYDVYDVDAGINLSAYNWNFGSDHPIDTPTHQDIDFRGVAVHEMGHGAILIDVSSCLSPTITMCDSVAPGLPTEGLRTPEADDKNAANSLYP